MPDMLAESDKKYSPVILPVSDLENYTSVINQVSYGNRVHLTEDGNTNWALIDMRELDELDKDSAFVKLMSKLNKAKISIRREGTISSDDLKRKLGV